MENVSHLFMFKGKLQTKSPSPPKIWSPPPTSNTILNALDTLFCQNWDMAGGESSTQTCQPPHVAPIVCAESSGPLAFVHITKPLATIHANTEKILSL